MSRPGRLFEILAITLFIILLIGSALLSRIGAFYLNGNIAIN
jgi:hypothetical protein